MKIKLKDPEKLQKELLINGFTQRSFARKAGVGQSYFSQIVNGKRDPGPDVSKRITDALGTDFDDIFFIDIACKSEHESRQEAI